MDLWQTNDALGGSGGYGRLPPYNNRVNSNPSNPFAKTLA